MCDQDTEGAHKRSDIQGVSKSKTFLWLKQRKKIQTQIGKNI